MDSFEWNKIAGWVLTAAIAVLGLSIVTGALYTPYVPEKPVYVVEGVEVEAGEGTEPGAAAEPPIEALLASADLGRGEAVFKKCTQCHNVEKGGGNGIGPNLWGTVGSKLGHTAGFGYSSALTGKGGVWDWTALNAWLKSPKAYIPGNKMSFAGLGKPEDRAAVIAYLNSKSDSPLPLPAAPAPTAEAAAPAAEGSSTTPGDQPGEAAATSGATPTAEKPAPAPGKAPDVPANVEPSGPTGGPGAPAVAGTSKQETIDRQR